MKTLKYSVLSLLLSISCEASAQVVWSIDTSGSGQVQVPAPIPNDPSLTGFRSDSIGIDNGWTGYSEFISTHSQSGTDTAFTSYSAGTTHSTPINIMAAANALTYGSVTTTNTPAPSLLATATAAATPGETNIYAYSQGMLQYDISVLGVANTWVPISFSGQYQMSGSYDLFNPGVSRAPVTTVSFDVISSNFSGMGEGFSASWENSSGCSSNATPSMNFTQYQTNTSLTGSFNGSISILTDANGYGSLTARMNAQALSNASYASYIPDFNGVLTYNPSAGRTMFASAFIDPEFHIDDNWLASNSGFSLTIPDGIGNSSGSPITTPVPEPETYAMLLAGLGLIGFTARRRKNLAA